MTWSITFGISEFDLTWFSEVMRCLESGEAPALFARVSLMESGLVPCNNHQQELQVRETKNKEWMEESLNKAR